MPVWGLRVLIQPIGLGTTQALFVLAVVVFGSFDRRVRWLFTLNGSRGRP